MAVSLTYYLECAIPVLGDNRCLRGTGRAGSAEKSRWKTDESAHREIDGSLSIRDRTKVGQFKFAFGYCLNGSPGRRSMVVGIE